MKELFSKDALMIDSEIRDWEEAIRVTGRLLLKRGSIEEEYIDAMIDAVKELGAYIVIVPHFAIAHAAAATHVVNNDMVLVVFKEPVIFGSENDPVHLMIGMCALKSGSHLEQFKSIADILSDEDVWQRFLACDTIDQLYDLVNGKSN